jgi:excisionase family DNA binding protein
VLTLADLGDRATLTVSETAELLGVSRDVAYESARRGEIPTLRLGRRVLVSVPRLLTLLGAPIDGADVDEGSPTTGGESDFL